MKRLSEWNHAQNRPAEGGQEVPGVLIRAWLISSLAIGALMAFVAFAILDAGSIEDGTVIDARTLPSTRPAYIPLKPAENTQEMRRTAQISLTLYIITERAGMVTASVGIAGNRFQRMIAAGNAAQNVLRFAQVTEELTPGSTVAKTLQELAWALSTYDIDSVRNAGFKLANLRQQLLDGITASQRIDKTHAGL